MKHAPQLTRLAHEAIRLSSSALLRVSSKSLHHLRGSTLALEPLFGDVNQPKRIDIGIQALQRNGSEALRISTPVFRSQWRCDAATFSCQLSISWLFRWLFRLHSS